MREREHGKETNEETLLTNEVDIAKVLCIVKQYAETMTEPSKIRLKWLRLRKDGFIFTSRTIRNHPMYVIN